MWSNLQETVDLVAFTKDILNENLIFCAVLLFCFGKKRLAQEYAFLTKYFSAFGEIFRRLYFLVWPLPD